MKNKPEQIPVIIVGGGLAGLSLAGLLAAEGIPVVVVEKEDYPRHKVCGEFISRESIDFLNRSGVIKKEDKFPIIDHFELVFPNGKSHVCKLDPGGVGISRYTLDYRFYKAAQSKGVHMEVNDKVNSIKKTTDEKFLVILKSGKRFLSDIVVLSSGRYSAGLAPEKREKNDRMSWFGVKYHINLPMKPDLIRIMMFEGGYAGVSAVENEKYCFCYLARTHLLKKFKGDIAAFENAILKKNPVINQLLSSREIIEGPFTTSGFHFGYRQLENDGVFYCGDSGAFIPPLTGNGMSLALRSASVLGPLLSDYFNERMSKQEVIQAYKKYGDNYLKNRISSGLFLQQLALDPGPVVQRLLSGSMSIFPFLLKNLSNKASGKPF